MCAALVADYGSDTSDSENEDVVIKLKEEENVKAGIESKAKDAQLVSADEILGEFVHGKSTSVFANPFLEAENKQLQSLEKHVRLTDTNKISKLGEKNICWKFLKGLCKYGAKCKYAHPDLQSPSSSSVPTPSASQLNIATEAPVQVLKNDCDSDEEKKIKKKKRSGLTNTLHPPKKFIKVYNKFKNN